MKEIYQTTRILLQYKKYLIEMFLAGIALSLLQVPQPLFLKVLVDTAYPSKDMNLVVIVLVSVFVLAVGSQMLSALRSYLQVNVSTAMSYNCRIDFFRHILNLPHSFIGKRQVGELLSRFSDLDAALTGVSGLLFGAVTNTLSLIIFPGILIFLNWKLALLAISLVPLDGYVYYHANKFLRKYARINSQKNADLYGSMNEGITGYLTIKALNLCQTVIDTYSIGLSALRETVIKSDAIQLLSGFVVATLRALATFCYAFYGWNLVVSGELTLGSFLAFTGYIGYLYGPIRGLMNMSQQFQVALVHTERFLEIQDIPQEPAGVITSIHDDVVCPLSMTNVTFGYSDGNVIFTDLTVEFPPGSTTYVTGKSGSGKTTLACLLSGTTRPLSGAVLLGQHSIHDYSRDALDHYTGFALQEPFIFRQSITHNITCGSAVLTEQHVREVADLVCLTDEINAMPDGFNTLLGEKGANLSTGQKQRIALARVLVRRPKILILDEALSAVDIERKRTIWDSIRRNMEHSTLIYVTHDAQSINNGARIITIVSHDRVLCSYAGSSHVLNGVCVK